PFSAGYQLPSSVTSSRGTNLYKNTKKANENSRFKVRTQEETSSGLALSASASLSAALAENRRALIPKDIACPNVPNPRSTGYLKRGYFSDIRGTGVSCVIISPLGLRTATQ